LTLSESGFHNKKILKKDSKMKKIAVILISTMVVMLMSFNLNSKTRKAPGLTGLTP